MRPAAAAIKKPVAVTSTVLTTCRAGGCAAWIPHFILDIREEFGDFVIENFVEEYMAGVRPILMRYVPNTHIKWRALLKRANALGCDFIATGHYANVYQGSEWPPCNQQRA